MTEYAILSPAEAVASALALPSGATMVLFGASDTGKTTCAIEMLRALTRSGKTAALIDCDIGQGEIGPPGTVGLAIAEAGREVRSLRELTPLSTYFIGATSPAQHVLDWCVGTCQMARLAKKRRPDLILIDTCGWVNGSAAVQANRRLAELLLPHVIYAFARTNELQPLLNAFAHLSAPEMRRVTTSPEVGRKTSAMRSTRRIARLMASLKNATDITLPWNDVDFPGARIGSGETLPHHILQFISQSLRLPALHAETLPGGSMYIVVNGERWDAAGLTALEGYFRTQNISVVPAQNFAGLYVGLVNKQSVLLDVGLITRLDFGARTITIRTACQRPAAVAQVWMGAIRLHPDGRQKGETRPGDL